MAIFDRFFHSSDVKDNSEIVYTTIKVLDMSDDELKECSKLFSEYYGKYNMLSNIRPGEQIHMSVSRYKENYYKPNFYVALAKGDGKLVGHAFYLRKDYSAQGFGVMTWVLQLVVDNHFRKRGIASTLLRSIWGFSDDYAWGLATTNPCTIRTLESATFRKFKPTIVQKNIKAIKAIQADIPFAFDKEITLSRKTSQIDTQFFVDNSNFVNSDSDYSRYGSLKPGHEWLAFTFRKQGIIEAKYQQSFKDMLCFSESKLKEAYSRMNMSKHKWTQGTNNEVDFILRWGSSDRILDLGCGFGRHAIVLSEKGSRVTAIDFSERNIFEAKKELQLHEEENLYCEFIVADARTYRDEVGYDKVLCLYDVIGSFPEEKDNKMIIETAYEQLKPGGYLILSVMNMEYTKRVVSKKNIGIVERDMRVLQNLPPSRIMQSSGNVFDPKYLAIDVKTQLVYRKEQFSDDGLSAEYIIRDKRYTMDEIKKLVVYAGFAIEYAEYTRVNHFGDGLKKNDNTAKEICIVAKKVCY